MREKCQSQRTAIRIRESEITARVALCYNYNNNHNKYK